DDDEGAAAVGRHGVEQTSKRLDAARRRADTDDGATGIETRHARCCLAVSLAHHIDLCGEARKPTPASSIGTAAPAGAIGGAPIYQGTCDPSQRYRRSSPAAGIRLPVGRLP